MQSTVVVCGQESSEARFGCGRRRSTIPTRRGLWQLYRLIRGERGATMISLRSLPVRLSEIEFPKKARDKLSPGALILLVAIALAGNDAFSAEDTVSAEEAVTAEDVVSSVKVPLTG